MVQLAAFTRPVRLVWQKAGQANVDELDKQQIMQVEAFEQIVLWVDERERFEC